MSGVQNSHLEVTCLVTCFKNNFLGITNSPRSIHKETNQDEAENSGYDSGVEVNTLEFEPFRDQ